jgi:arginine/lysine/ornithine decarboxylase
LIYPPKIGVVLPGERWDARAQSMLAYFTAFQESLNRFPGFNFEVQDVFHERENGRIRFYTYVVRAQPDLNATYPAGGSTCLTNPKR